VRVYLKGTETRSPLLMNSTSLPVLENRLGAAREKQAESREQRAESREQRAG
jgi:hypothetical protein